MQTTFRSAKLLDIPAMVELAVESVRRDPLPVTISRNAMAEILRVMVSSPAHFCWVGEQGGQIVSALAAMTQPGFWFERQQCSVLLYYTRAPGASTPLMRRFSRWVKSRPAIKLAVFELEPGAEPKLRSALARMGFARESMNMTYVREAA